MGGLTYNAFTLSTGNPDLKPELGKSTDFGFVYNPSFLPRFNFSVDYFRVEINEAIGSASTGSGKGQNIIDQCYAGQSQYCSALIRGGPVVSGVSKILYVNQTNFNLASQKVDGIDISANYRTPVSNIVHGVGGDLSFRVLATNTFHDTTISGIPGDIPIDTSGTNAGNGPASWRVFSTVAYEHNGLSATLIGRGISAGKYDMMAVVKHEVDEFLGVGGSGCEGLFHQDMFTRFEGGFSERVMRRDRRGEHDGGDVRLAQHLGGGGDALRAGILPKAAGEALGVFLNDQNRGKRTVE